MPGEEIEGVMRRSVYRLLVIGIVCVLMLGSRAVHAQTDGDVCGTKDAYYRDDLAFSPNSKFLVTSWHWEKGIVRIWNVESGNIVHTLDTNRDTYGLGRYAFSSDTRFLFTSAIYTALWDMQTGERIYEIEPDGQPYGESAPKIVVSPDDRYFILTSDAGTRLYNLKSGKQLNRFMGITVQLASFSDDSRYILMEENGKGFEGALIVWDIQANRKVHTFNSDVLYGSFVAGGQYIATINPNEIVDYTLWDATTYKQVLTADVVQSTDIEFSPNGNFLVGSDVLWDAVKGTELHVFNNLASPHLKFSPDSNYLFVYVSDPKRSDRRVHRIWDIKLNKEKPNFSLTDEQYTAAFSPDNKFLATASDNGQLRLWNLETGEEVHLDC